QGGVWETRDEGSHWTARTDNQASLAIGALAFDPANSYTIYAGTGEPNGSLDSYFGAGLLKSTDGGATWELLAQGTFANTSFSDIKIDPRNANRLVAATVRGLAGFGAESPPNAPPTGLFRSVD